MEMLQITDKFLLKKILYQQQIRNAFIINSTIMHLPQHLAILQDDFISNVVVMVYNNPFYFDSIFCLTFLVF